MPNGNGHYPKAYPADWQDIRAAILERAGGCCEGSPLYPDCRAANHKPHPATGSKVVLTIAHLDHDITNSDPAYLRAWCQRCHNSYDVWFRRRKGKNKLVEFPYYWRVKTRLPQYKNYPCRVLQRGAKNTVTVQFPDGQIVATSGNYYRKRCVCQSNGNK